MVLHGIYALNHGLFISWKINTRNVGGGMRVFTAKKSAKSYLNIVREIASLENPRVLWFRQPVVDNPMRKKVTLFIPYSDHGKILQAAFPPH